MLMPFGKYKGQELEDVMEMNPSYIVWLKDNCDLRGELLEFVKKNYRDCKINTPKILPPNSSRYDQKDWIEEHGGDPEEYGWTEAWGFDD